MQRFLTVTLLATLGCSLHSQQPSNWTTITQPSNQPMPPASIGTTVTFQTSNSFYLFSGITKKWTVLPVSNAAPIFQANDYCIIQDGTKIHGYASHTGQVDTITTSGTATVVSGPASSSWVTLVTDGTTAWGFGAFHGKFEKITLTQPSPALLSNRLIGLLRDGPIVYALSAHHGTFVPVSADTAAVLQVVGEAEVATANSPGFFRAFSAQQNKWGVQAVPATATAYQQNEFAMVWSGNQVWAFSGLSGVLDTYTASAPLTGMGGAEGVAAFLDGGKAVCYGAGRGRFVTKAVGGAAFVFDYHLALVVEPGFVTPFSAVTGAFGAIVPGTFIISSNDAIAYLDGGAGQSYAYTPILNLTVPAPAVSPTAVALVRDAVTLAHANGYTALSARYGTWVPKSTAVKGNFLAPNTGSTFLAIDGLGETAHVFDARLNRWATVTGTAPLTIKISRHTAMAHDGVTAFGFGQPSGEWYAEPLQAAPNVFDTASPIGAVVHGNKISVYSVQGSFSYTGRYPEFTQAINLGNTLTLHQVGPVGSGMILLVGLAPARIDLGAPLGILYVDPSGLVPINLPQTIGPSGIAEIALPVPNDPGLVGARLHFQDLVVPAAAPPWLSSSVAPILF